MDGGYAGEMAMNTDLELLRRYLAENSESAFTELVKRHVDLVYSAALRQVNGNRAVAEEVTQAVFTDLAVKAKRLTAHTSLAGWLFTSTRYRAANVRRSESRRRTREEEAYRMSPQPDSNPPELVWEELRPVLDEALHELKPQEREAILLRYFERYPYAEVGARLGLKENAARMRVDRALEKLRGRFAKRGIRSTAAGLGTVLGTYGVITAPVGMAAQISQVALSGAAAGGGIASWVQVMNTLKFKLLVGTAAVATIVTPLVWNAQKSSPAEEPAVNQVSVHGGESSGAESQAQMQPASDASEPTAGSTESGGPEETDLRLTIVAGDTGEPIPNATVDYRVWAEGEFVGREYDSRRDGVCEISFPPGTTQVELTSRVEGYADTRLEWRPDRGETVPENYRLELERAVPIGGTVVDANGNTVAGAKVGFNHEPKPGQTPRPENHQFGWIEVTTDDQGHWRINRIGEDIIGRIYGSAKHPHHVGSDMLHVNRVGNAEERLRDEEYVFHLKQAFTVKGSVQDATGMPISNAKVLVGQVGSSGRREINVRYDGTFILHGCEPGDQLISAEAPGYAPTTRRIEIGREMQSVKLTLEEGKTLKLRVVNAEGKPVPKANVWLDTFGHRRTHFDKPAPVTVQTEFDAKTDADGRVVWKEAPDRTLRFDVHRSGYMRLNGIEIRPDGEEHVVTLNPALVVKGTVRDASTDRLIPKFKIICGWPSVTAPDGEMQPRWSSLERFWLDFAEGRFRHSFEEPLVVGTTNRGYILKFEAEGYAPYVSRVLAADESEVELNVELEPAPSKTVTVLTPDGGPAVRADVGLVRTGNRIRFLGDRLDSSTGGSVVTTDQHGLFELSPDESITRLLIAHESGFAWVDRETVEQQGQITLQAGGRIEGVALDGDQPVTGELLRLQFSGESAQRLSPDHNRFKVKTDERGRFAFPPVPAGEYEITLMIPQPQRNGNPVWSLHPVRKTTVEPGSTTTLKLDVSNTEVPQ